MAAPLNEHDFAIVIGISRYPNFEGLLDLTAPEPDAEAVSAWLMDPTRGSLPHDNLTELRSPTLREAEEAFKRMVERFVDDPGRRLYIFGSGRGLVNEPDGATLLMADASPGQLGNSIDLRAYADDIYNNGLFSEVVLFADVLHTEMPGGISTKSPWTITRATRKGNAWFYGFAAKIGTVAYEASEPDESSPQGYFTRSVLEGLYGGAADDTGRIDSSGLQLFIERRLEELTAETNMPEMRPEFMSGGVQPIVLFVVTPPRPRRP